MPNYYNEMFPNGTGGYGGGYGGGNQLGGSRGDSGGDSSFGGPDYGQAISSGMNLLGNLFTNPQSPYNDAMNQFQNWNQQGANMMNPYQQMGSSMIPQYQNWLKSMQNPAQFQNNLMQNYQESPYAKFMQQQMLRSAVNEGSASGTVGSTPYTQQIQQNAGNISSMDMNNWIQNVLGLNTMYGQGMSNMIGMGENAGNSLMDLYGREAAGMGDLAYGKGAAQNNKTGSIFNDIGSIAKSFIPGGK